MSSSDSSLYQWPSGAEAFQPTALLDTKALVEIIKSKSTFKADQWFDEDIGVAMQNDSALWKEVAMSFQQWLLEEKRPQCYSLVTADVVRNRFITITNTTLAFNVVGWLAEPISKRRFSPAPKRQVMRAPSIVRDQVVPPDDRALPSWPTAPIRTPQPLKQLTPEVEKFIADVDDIEPKYEEFNKNPHLMSSLYLWFLGTDMSGSNGKESVMLGAWPGNEDGVITVRKRDVERFLRKHKDMYVIASRTWNARFTPIASSASTSASSP